MAKNYDGKAVNSSPGSREYRIGLVTARLNENRLFFDFNGPGIGDNLNHSDRDHIHGLYCEMSHVHRKKQRNGEIVLNRDKDDRTAALEDAIEALDGRILRDSVPQEYKMKYKKHGRKRELNRV